jgi:hypothetical protein
MERECANPDVFGVGCRRELTIVTADETGARPEMQEGSLPAPSNRN